MAAKTLDMTEGGVLKNLVLFGIPVLLGNVFQQFYNIADAAVIGNFLGDSALAAMGAASPVYALIINFAYGMTNGFSVVLARAFGAGDREKMSRTVCFSYILSAAAAVVITLASIFLSSPLLLLLKTPETVVGEAGLYLRTVFSFAAASVAYNLFSGMLRAVGNTRAPLVFLIIASVVNVILDIVFIKFFALGIFGAAVATAISQLLSAVLCIVYVIRAHPDLLWHRKNMVNAGEIVPELSLMGASMGLMLAIVAVGSVILQRAVNLLGEATVTAHVAARKIDEIFMMVLGTISMSASTFVSQNFGAGDIGRVKKGIRYSFFIGFGWSTIGIIIVYLFDRPIIKMLTGTANGEIIDTASLYIRINILFFYVLTVLLTLRSSLQGVGHKLIPITGSVIELIMKIGAVVVIAPLTGYIGICFLEPAIWIICALIVLVDYLKFLKKSSLSSAQK